MSKIYILFKSLLLLFSLRLFYSVFLLMMIYDTSSFLFFLPLSFHSFLLLPPLNVPFDAYVELMFLETSALTGENVEEGFLKCARTILNKIDSGTHFIISLRGVSVLRFCCYSWLLCLGVTFLTDVVLFQR